MNDNEETETEKHYNDKDMTSEDEQMLEEMVIKLRDWAGAQPHLVNPRLDDRFLLRFLRHRKFNFNDSQLLLEKYMKARTKFPHCFQLLDIETPGVLDLLSNGYVFPLPETDHHGRVVIFGIAGIMDPKRHKPSDSFRAYMSTFEVLLDDENAQKQGFSYIFDQTEFRVSHFTSVGLRELQRLMSTGEKAMPISHRKIHWFNMPRYLLFIYELFKNLLSQKIQERMVVHWNLESLHSHFPRKILPKEYGGEHSVKELAGRWVETLRQKREHLLSLDKMQYDESKKPTQTTDDDGSYGIMKFMGRLARLDIL
ncbi:clavesin-1-like isoform X2 [Limulus polyphemus]|uniref:Clavesin-1-like isoform X2 n=1 Tax=Limulus polyphemus TaxID=6850 RepID=A0ABM1B5R5_LIMPO|nr:clavesin-1-like isoform X2 [Limulus polyphemus]